MELTKLERLNLINQFEILKNQKESDSSMYESFIEILRNGYKKEYYRLIEFVYDDVPDKILNQTMDILEMYYHIQCSFRNLNDNSGIDSEKIKFRGFDGNREHEYLGYMKFLNSEGRFHVELKGSDQNFPLNSHFPMVDTYRRQYLRFKTIKNRKEESNDVEPWHFSKEEIIEILN